MDLETRTLELYDKAYAICHRFGIVTLAHRLTAKQRAVRRPRPTHTIMCECRKCKPSVNSYWRRMKAIE